MGAGFAPAVLRRLPEAGSGGGFAQGGAVHPLSLQQQHMGHGGVGPQGSTMPLPVQLQAWMGGGSMQEALGGLQGSARPPQPQMLSQQQQQGPQQAQVGSGQHNACRVDVDDEGASGQPIAGASGNNAYQALLRGVAPTPEGRASGAAAAVPLPAAPVQGASGEGSQNASVGDQQPTASGAGAEQEHRQPSASRSGDQTDTGAAPTTSSGAQDAINVL